MENLSSVLDSSRACRARPVVQLMFMILLLLSLLRLSHAQLFPVTYQPARYNHSSLTESGEPKGRQLNQTSRAWADDSKSYNSTGNSASAGFSSSLNESVSTNQTVTSSNLAHHYIVGCGNDRFNGDQGKEAFADFSKFCYLWNSSCSSQSTLGLKNIQTILALSYYNPCFGGGCQCMVDGMPAPPASTSSLASLVEFLRSPQCPVLFNSTSICCGRYGTGRCHFGLTAIDLYYWPVANANTSCLSVVGSDTTPLGQGATTVERPYMQSSLVYWISTDVCKLDEAPWKTTEEVVYARLTTVSGLEFKFYSYNPWDHNEKCTPLKPSGPGATAPADHGLTTIQTRKQSSITETLANDGGERHRNVVALDGLTLYVQTCS